MKNGYFQPFFCWHDCCALLWQIGNRRNHMETLHEKKRRKLAFPETALLLLIIIAVAAGLTYIMPAGQFERVVDEATGRELVKAGTYTVMESNQPHWWSCSPLYSEVSSRPVRLSGLSLWSAAAFGIVSRTGAIACRAWRPGKEIGRARVRHGHHRYDCFCRLRRHLWYGRGSASFRRHSGHCGFEDGL